MSGVEASGRFGELLRRHRSASGLPQERLASLSGVSVRAIANMERGRTTRPYYYSVRSLADALALPGPEREQLVRAARTSAASDGMASGQVTAATAVGGTQPPAAVPRQLPAAVPHFAGRATELKLLSNLLDTSQGAGGTVIISAIAGTAGVGKTTLAVRWAHQVADRFPDGQLYVNLRGFDPSATPVAPEHVIRGFLEALQVAPERIPASPDAQAGLYRTLLAGRRMLIVLDNARDEQQVRQLLPATPSCLVAVTSRSGLSGLVAADAAQRVSLDLLSESEARELLTLRLGAGPVTAEPDAVTELISLCARLPLALVIAAARAAAHPGHPLAAVAEELRARQSRLAALDAGEPATSVRAVFSWSCHGLSPAAARLFRLLGLHPGPDITVPAAAGLGAVSPELSRELLHELTRAGLLSEQAPGRFAFHDLLRAYAAEQALARDTEQEARPALTGLLGYYLAAAAAAVNALFPAEKHRLAPPSATALPGAPVSTAAGLDWLDAERANLVAVTAHAAASGWPGHAIRLATIMYRYLEVGGHFLDALTVYACALEAAQHTGDLAAQADCLKNLGTIEASQGHYQQAADKVESARQLYHKIDDRRGQARTLSTLGGIDWCQSRYQHAANYLRQALAIYTEMGERLGKSFELASLGRVACRQGHYEQAADYIQDALAICRELGNLLGEANALDDLGDVLCCQGRYERAASHHRQALAIFHELGDRLGEASALQHFGRVLQQQARYQQAARHQLQALAVFREVGDPLGEAESLNFLGEALSGVGTPVQARARHHHALALACQVGAPYEQARAHDGLASTYQATGDHGQACHHWRHALSLYTDLAVPDADEVRVKLMSVPQPSDPLGR